MSYENKEGQGSLWKNEHKEKDTHADYQGTIKIAGNEYYLNAWVKETVNKKKYFSLSAKVKAPKPDAPSEPKKPANEQKVSGFDDFSDDIPF